MLGGLEQVGWKAERLAEPCSLPAEILERYPTMPAEYRDFVETTGFVVGPGETSWLVTGSIFNATAPCVWPWNAWELQSLEAAGDHQNLVKEIRSFWDQHLPIVMSTKSCYAYFALDLESHRIVQGEEPIYEDVGAPIASSLDEMFRLIVERDERVKLFV
jgi:hypothetical protein